MSKQKHDIPGNAVGSQAAFEKSILNGAGPIVRADTALGRLWDDGIEFRGLSVRPPRVAGGDWLVVVRAVKDGSASVAFVSDTSVWDVLRKTFAQLENKSLRWKDDDYAR